MDEDCVPREKDTIIRNFTFEDEKDFRQLFWHFFPAKIEDMVASGNKFIVGYFEDTRVMTEQEFHHGMWPLPHLSFVLRKPKPLGTEFKTVADADTGVMLFLEIQEGAQGMRAKKHVDAIGGQSACGVRLGEGSVGCRSDDGQRVCYGDAWFGSVRGAVAHHKSGMHFVGSVKTVHKQYPKKELERRLEGNGEKPSGRRSRRRGG
jgi:hypothetical protein